MKLFPIRKPYTSGHFDVGDNHKIFYALYGNPSGVPVLFVHGGPGAGCGKDAFRHFDPRKFNILIVDQRGAGKSVPFGEVKNNTTQLLVEDFRKLLDFLNIRKTLLFGGSWGSCLSLCFAIKYPARVIGMVLRGIFLGSREENDYFLNGGAKSHFPQVWERFTTFVPKGLNPARYYWKMMNSKNKVTARKFCHEWALYEFSMLKLEYDLGDALKNTRSHWVVSTAKLEASYLLNDCFLPKNYILNNVDKIKHLPISLVQGRYDFICPPINAYELHKSLPKSKLFLVTAGHSASEGRIRETMMEEIHKLV